MPRVNHTIDDRSPLIRYAPTGTWSLGNRTDPFTSRYSNNGSFTLCTTAGSSATFTFNGTGVWIHGARRGNHGPYEINLDNDVARFDGFRSTEDFTTPLFSVDNLSNGLHTVSIINRREASDARPYLDIDFITWTSEVQNVSASQQVIPHTAGAFRYEPASAWSQPIATGFNSTTAHSTITTHAQALLTFTGSAVSMFGAVSSIVAPYSVQLDDRPAQNYDGRVNEYTPQTMPYFADNLGPGNHTLKIVNLPAAEGQGLFLDFALVVEARSFDASPEKQSARDMSSEGLSSGAIAGIAVGAVALLASILLAFFLWRNKKARPDHTSMMIEGRPLPPSSLVYAPFTMSSTAQSTPLPPSERHSAPSTSELPPHSIYPRSSMSQVSRPSGSCPLYTTHPSEPESPRERSYPASVGTPGHYPPDSKRSTIRLSHTVDQSPYSPVPDVEEESPPSYESHQL